MSDARKVADIIASRLNNALPLGTPTPEGLSLVKAEAIRIMDELAPVFPRRFGPVDIKFSQSESPDVLKYTVTFPVDLSSLEVDEWVENLDGGEEDK